MFNMDAALYGFLTGGWQDAGGGAGGVRGGG